jgi:adenylate cyclase
MVVFGIGAVQADHATRAVRAARAMQRAMVAIAPELHAHGWNGISLGVGMETGRVVAGHVGGPDLCEYTVLGDVVNVASRLTAGAGGGEVVLGPGAAAAVCESHQLVSLGEISIRGRRQPVVAWRLRSP